MESQNVEPDFSIKLLVLGDLSVGKTSFIYRFIEDKFEVDDMATTGLDLKTADVIIADKKVRVQLWDTAGQEKYNSITKNLLLRVQGIIILFDITNKDSFNNLNLWIKIINEHCGDKMSMIIVGNKCDLEENRAVSKEEIYNYIKKMKKQFIETSCKTGKNIKKAVDNIIKKIINSLSEKKDISFSLESTCLNQIKKKKCC